MGAIKRAMENKAELAMMGKCIPVENEDEVNFITHYILAVMDKQGHFLDDFDIYDEIHRYNEENKVTHICTCTVMDMPCIVYCIDTQDGETPKPFEEDYGSGYPASFCYVFNIVAHDTCSEFGDCFFKKMEDDYYHRVS